MKKEVYKKMFLSLVVLFPAVVGATTFKDLAGDFIELLNQFVYVLTGFSFVFFLYGVVRFIGTAGDDKSREQGRKLMVWGIISLFVMFAVWGLVGILQSTFFGI